MSEPMDKMQLEAEVVLVLRKLHSLTKGRVSFSLEAVQLILGTIAQESAFGKYREQLGGGPAKGIVQMEGATALDIFENYLNYRKDIKDAVLSLTTNDIVPSNKKSLERHLKYQDEFAIAMCRIHYLRAPAKLPSYDDVEGFAEYWKKYYNTEKGAGTTEEFVKNYNRYIGE